MSKRNRWDKPVDNTEEVVEETASEEVIDTENKEDSVAEDTTDPVAEAQEEVAESLIASTETEPVKEELEHVAVPPVVAFDPAPVGGDNTATSIVEINKKEEKKVGELKKVFVKGQVVRLANAKVYATSKTSAIKTYANGTYYIADGIQKDGRLRISSAKNATPRTIVGFVNYADIK